MSDHSAIEWTDSTWNPVTGCAVVSPGCAHCYAKTFAERFRGVPGHPYEQGFDLKLWPTRLEVPLTWRTPRRVFVNSMSDLFHPDVPVAFIQQVFETMQRATQHQFQVLTKRPERAREVGSMVLWPDNVWLGVSVENQHWTTRIDTLREIPTAVRFLSCEPLIGPMPRLPLAGVHWVIVGGESAPGARPMEKAWVEQIRDRCLAQGVAFFFKQWGGVQQGKTGRRLCGRTWDSMPAEADHRGTSRLVQAV